jgi:hypothetical protein
VNSAEYKEGRIPKELFSHEITHINQRHSIDIIFVEILKVLFWFNPLIYLFKNAIRLNHEYLADDAVTKSETNHRTYLNIILSIAFRNNNSYLASSFNYSFTKKRLLMMTKNNFSRTAILKKIAVIPLFIALGLFAVNSQDTIPGNTSALPPPPSGNNTWWHSVLAQYKITPNPSKSWYSQNVFETGEQFIKEGNKVILKDAQIFARSIGSMYRVIKAK